MSASPKSAGPRRSSWRAIAPLLVAITMLACDAPTASRPDFAFDPTSLSNGVLYRWPSGQQIRVWTPALQAPGPDMGRAVRAAVATWNAQPQFAEFELSLVTDPSQANLIVFEASQPNPITPATCAFNPRAAVGYTYFCGDGGRAERMSLASGAASTVSVVIRIDRGLVSDQAGLDAIVAHEFGHALGIGSHSGEPTDLMFGLPRVSQPSARDTRTLQYVLGAVADLLL